MRNQAIRQFSAALLLVLALGVGSFLGAPTQIANAHGVEPLSASPAEGAVLTESPEQVRLTFAEEISETGNSLGVFNEKNVQVDLGDGGVDLNDPQHEALVASLPALSEGIYLVKWKVTLTDGDSSEGQYTFGIGNVILPAAPVEHDENDTKSGFSVWYWIIGAALLIAVIAAGIWWFRKGLNASAGHTDT
jgi:methionine-rich copper-binding protein CopC